MHDDPGRLDAGRQRDRQLATGADVEPGALLADPARDVGRQQRLGGVHDFDVAQRGAVALQPVPKVGLVENVGGGSEFVGDIRQRHVTDT